MDNRNNFKINLKAIKKENVLSVKSNVNSKTENEKPKKLDTSKSSKTNKLSIKLNRKLLFIALIALVFLILIISLFLVYKYGETYYQGTWIGEITESDKQAGVEKIIFKISDEEISQIIESSKNNVKAEVIIDYKVSILNKRSAETYFKLEDIELSFINVNVPKQLCPDSGDCESIKNKYIQIFKESVEKQKKELINSNVRFSYFVVENKLVFSNRYEVKLRKI